MRRFGPILSLMALVMAGAVALGGLSGAGAQDATPPSARQAGTPEPIRSTTVASGSIEITSPGTAGLVLGRIRFAPGASGAFDSTNTAVSLIYIVDGALTVRMAAPMTVVRAGANGTPAPEQPEEVAADTEFTLRDGDSAMVPPATPGEIRNDGDSDASAWVVNVVLRSDAPSTPGP